MADIDATKKEEETQKEMEDPKFHEASATPVTVDMLMIKDTPADEKEAKDTQNKKSEEETPKEEEDPKSHDAATSKPVTDDVIIKEAPADEKEAEDTPMEKMTDEADTPKKEIKKRGQRNKLDPVPEPSGKRQRKSAESYKPPDFTEVTPLPEVSKGRGIKLKDIPALRAGIEGVSANDPMKEIFNAFRFLFPFRAKTSHQEKKERLLDFSGFLSPIEKDEDKEKREKVDEDAEAKMTQKAYKLTIPEIKALCDFFCVDRSPPENEKNIDKETLVDRLLNFLGSPSTEAIKESAKNVVATSDSLKKKKESVHKKSRASKGEIEEKPSPKKEIVKEVTEKGKMPTDKELRKWVQAYVACFDLDKATTKHALQTASDKFGLDLGTKKARIKELLTEEM